MIELLYHFKLGFQDDIGPIIKEVIF